MGVTKRTGEWTVCYSWRSTMVQLRYDNWMKMKRRMAVILMMLVSLVLLWQ